MLKFATTAALVATLASTSAAPANAGWDAVWSKVTSIFTYGLPSTGMTYKGDGSQTFPSVPSAGVVPITMQPSAIGDLEKRLRSGEFVKKNIRHQGAQVYFDYYRAGSSTPVTKQAHNVYRGSNNTLHTTVQIHRTGSGGCDKCQ